MKGFNRLLASAVLFAQVAALTLEERLEEFKRHLQTQHADSFRSKQLEHVAELDNLDLEIAKLDEKIDDLDRRLQEATSHEYQESRGQRSLRTERRLRRLEDLATALSCVDTQKSGRYQVIFKGCNVLIQNGLKSTNEVNTRGNLIIGYNEGGACNLGGSDCLRWGSHNVVVGPYHEYTRAGAIVAGYNNTSWNYGACVSGGNQNIASGYYSSVSGGFYNTAKGNWSSVVGGSNNYARGRYTTVTGGYYNTANNSAHWSVVVGGDLNVIESENSTILGGYENFVNGTLGVIVGGQGNSALSELSVILGKSGLNTTTLLQTIPAIP